MAAMTSRRTLRGARVGIYWTEASINAKKNAIDNDELQLDQSQSAYYKKVKAETTATGKPADPKFVAWRTQFQQWQFDWSTYKTGAPDCWVGCGITIANSGRMDDFDDRLKVLTSTFESLSGSKLFVPPNPAEGNGGGGTDPLSKAASSITTLIWVVGIGVVVYLGLVYVAPALLGAAARAKGSVRELRSA